MTKKEWGYLYEELGDIVGCDIGYVVSFHPPSHGFESLGNMVRPRIPNGTTL